MKPMLSVLILIMLCVSCQKELSVNNAQQPQAQPAVPVIKKDTVKLNLIFGANIVPAPGDSVGSASGQYAVVAYDNHTLPKDVYVTLMWDETNKDGVIQRTGLKYIVTLTVDKQAVSAYTGITTMKENIIKNLRITEIKTVVDSNYFFKW